MALCESTKEEGRARGGSAITSKGAGTGSARFGQHQFFSILTNLSSINARFINNSRGSTFFYDENEDKVWMPAVWHTLLTCRTRSYNISMN